MDYNINPSYTYNHTLVTQKILTMHTTYAPFFLITMQHVSISTYAPSPWLLSLCHLFPFLHLCQLFLLNHMPPSFYHYAPYSLDYCFCYYLYDHTPLTTMPLFHNNSFYQYALMPMHNLFPRLPSSLFFCFYAISCFILICCPVKGLLVSSLLHNHLLALYYKYHLVFPESLSPISSLGIKKYCLALVISLFENYYSWIVYIPCLLQYPVWVYTIPWNLWTSSLATSYSSRVHTLVLVFLCSPKLTQRGSPSSTHPSQALFLKRVVPQVVSQQWHDRSLVFSQSPYIQTQKKIKQFKSALLYIVFHYHFTSYHLSSDSYPFISTFYQSEIVISFISHYNPFTSCLSH